MYVVELGSLILTLKNIPDDHIKSFEKLIDCQGEILKLIKNSNLIKDLKEIEIPPFFKPSTQVLNPDMGKYVPIHFTNAICFKLKIQEKIYSKQKSFNKMMGIEDPLREYFVIYNGFVYLTYCETSEEKLNIWFGTMIRDTLMDIFNKSELLLPFIIPPSVAHPPIYCVKDDIKDEKMKKYYFKIPKTFKIENYLVKSLQYNMKELSNMYGVSSKRIYLESLDAEILSTILEILHLERKLETINLFKIKDKYDINNMIDNLLNIIYEDEVKLHDTYIKYVDSKRRLLKRYGNGMLDDVLIPFHKNIIEYNEDIINYERKPVKEEILNYIQQKRMSVKNINATLKGAIIGAIITILSVMITKYL